MKNDELKNDELFKLIDEIYLLPVVGGSKESRRSRRRKLEIIREVLIQSAEKLERERRPQ